MDLNKLDDITREATKMFTFEWRRGFAGCVIPDDAKRIVVKDSRELAERIDALQRLKPEPPLPVLLAKSQSSKSEAA